MSQASDIQRSLRLLLVLAATLVLAIGMSLGNPGIAAGFDEPDDGTEEDGTEDDGTEDDGLEDDGAEGDGFDNPDDGAEDDDGQEDEVLGETIEAEDETEGEGETPEGGVDAGFGGTARDGAGFGAPHAAAAGLLALALAGHAAFGRRESLGLS